MGRLFHSLRRRSTRLLCWFATAGTSSKRIELLKEVWPDTFVEEGVLAVNVAAIRKALSDGEEGRSYIETVPRRGYRFVGEVHALEEPRQAEAAVPMSRQRKKSSITTWGLAAGMLALVLAWLWLVPLVATANLNSATVPTGPAHHLSGLRTQSNFLTRRHSGGLCLEW